MKCKNGRVNLLSHKTDMGHKQIQEGETGESKEKRKLRAVLSLLHVSRTCCRLRTGGNQKAEEDGIPSIKVGNTCTLSIGITDLVPKLK